MKLEKKSEIEYAILLDESGIRIGTLWTGDDYQIAIYKNYILYGSQLKEIEQFVQNLSSAEEETPLEKFTQAYVDWDEESDADENFGNIVGNFIDVLKPLLKALESWDKNGDEPTDGDAELAEAYEDYLDSLDD